MLPIWKLNAGLRRALGGVLIALMISAVIVGDLFFGTTGRSAMFAGLFAWLAALCLIAEITSAQRIVIYIIAGVGVALIALALSRDAAVNFNAIIGGNARLLSMIAAVGFLRLVAIPPGSDVIGSIRGWGAYVKTVLGVSLFGSVINISAPILVADRLSVGGVLNRFSSQSITRVFSGCSAWSPFYGGMAAVLTYVPGAELIFLMPVCLPFALVGLMVVLLEARTRYRKEVADFEGYPLGIENLWIPLFLAIAVVSLSLLLSEISILTAIASAALLVTATMLMVRSGPESAMKALSSHVINGLPGMVNELLLFLSAGIIAAGLAGLISTGLLVLPAMNFNSFVAFAILGGVLALACLGVHPLIIVSGGTPILLALDPSPNLLAVVYLLAWSLGTSASPLSGTHLVFQGRYGVPSWQAAVWNWPYVAVMYAFSLPFLLAVEWLVTR